MKIIILCAPDARKAVPQLLKKLRELDVEASAYSIGKQWEKTELGYIRQYTLNATHFLVVLSKGAVKSRWLPFAAGYCIDRTRILVFYAEQKVSGLPSYLAEVPVYTEQENLCNFIVKETKTWKERQRRLKARKAIEESGIDFTEAAFVQCVEEGNIQTVKLFLEAGMDADMENKSGVSLLGLAVRNRHAGVIPLLLNYDADIDHKSKDRWDTPLMDAAAEGAEECVDTLIRAGADLDQTSKNGQTALILAIGRGNSVIASRLIRAGADVTPVDKLGMSAKKYATLFGYKDILRMIELSETNK
ncbi:MAG: ankyrin repeat domain-containing protein [Spirochaetia bacterium]